VSLGGNRVSRVRTYVNLILTMLLGGLWHGAAWTFVLWGGYHGLLLAGHRLLAERRPARERSRLATVLAQAGTFHLVVLGWVLFRAPSLEAAAHALGRLTVPGWVTIRAGSEAALLVAVGLLLHCAPDARSLRERFVRMSPVAQGSLYAAATVAAFFLAPASERFIYFQF
jgi:D-alanyl-lipoteichoic acid acyltransferase DltB (MBOAT superfamily)